MAVVTRVTPQMLAAAIAGAGPQHDPAADRPPFWRDRYALMLFCCLTALVSISLDLGLLSSIVKTLRWGILGVMCLPALRWLPQAFAGRLPAEHRFLTGFLIVSLISCGYSIMPLYSFERWGSFVLLWVALFGGAWVWLQERRNVYLGVDLLYALIVFVTVLSIIYTGQEGFLDRSERATGAFDKATGTGGFAAFAIPIILWKVQQSTGRKRAFAILMLLAQGYLLFFSGARAALLASCVSLSVLVWIQFRRFRGLMVLMVAGAVIAVVLGSVGLDMLPDYVVRKESLETMTGRLPRFKALLHVWQKRPLIGYGYGVGRYLIARDEDALEIYLDGKTETRSAQALWSANAQGKDIVIHTHSDHIERLAEGGILGYVFFAGFLATLLLRMPKALRRPRTPFNDLVVVLLAAIWPTIVDTLTHSAMFAVGNGPMVMAWFLLVMTMAADTSAQGQAQVPLALARHGSSHGYRPSVA